MNYRVDAKDEIVFVSPEWDRFAASNSGDGIMASLVLHHSIWDFISDPTTRDLYRQILQKSRAGHLLHFEFRCDSPGLRRLLEMTIVAADDGDVDFSTRTISTEEREPQAFLDPEVARSDVKLPDCSWCNKILIDGTWQEVDKAIANLQLFEQSYLPAMAHGVCETCFTKMTETIEDSQLV